MEKLLNILSPTSLTAFFHRVAANGLGSAFWWRVILWFGLLISVSIGIAAWITYGWAITEETIASPPANERAPVSIDDLRGVISLYQKKENDYQVLRQSSPSAPSPGLWRGGSVP